MGAEAELYTNAEVLKFGPDPAKWVPECPSVKCAAGWLFQHKLSSSLTEAERNEHILTKFRKYGSQGFANYMKGKKELVGSGPRSVKKFFYSAVL